MEAVVSSRADETTARDDEQERGLTLPLLDEGGTLLSPDEKPHAQTFGDRSARARGSVERPTGTFGSVRGGVFIHDLQGF